MPPPARVIWRCMRVAAAGGVLPTVAAAALLAAAPVAVTHAAAGDPSCATSSLVVWLNELPAGGTAGSVYYELEFTNLSAHTCTLTGYPGVSALNLRGGRLGGGASREVTRKPRTAILVSGASASAVLRIVDAGALASCTPAAAAGFKVYPPGQISSKVVPFPFQACAHSGRSNLVVQAIRPSG
jgi:Protein of unknown function (DUF4232)